MFILSPEEETITLELTPRTWCPLWW